ncbi:hypothetical protein [Nocardia noduli]|uniref:hypothetical protein n=1 Tax=Nocardia noduli TaxID=2815722 RepID=UPI001C24EA2C|nr:hypothetical protein [Nocardia noduli]
MTTPYLEAIAAITAMMIREILEDIAGGIVPETVRTYSELHDWVDANTYAAELVTEFEKTHDWLDFINDATDRVDVWLRAGRPGYLDQHTASSWHESTLIYLGEHADTLPNHTKVDRLAAAAAVWTEPNVYAPYTWREGMPADSTTHHQTT